MARGATSRQQRRERRQAAGVTMRDRIAEATIEASRASEGLALLAGASGSTTLPLSERDAAWDAGAARKTLEPADFAKAHFWQDADKPADQIGSYKLPFAKRDGGKLVAVWRGVTAGAARLSQTQGIDREAVQKKMAVYYRAAAKKYGDDGIKPPWTASADETSAHLLAYAEAAAGDDYSERLAYWEFFFSVADEFAESAAVEGLDSVYGTDGQTETDLDEQSARRESILDVLTAAGVDDSISTTYNLPQGSLGHRRFLAEALASDQREHRVAEWPCETPLGDHGEVLFRGNHDAVFCLDDGTLVYAASGHGWFSIEVATSARSAAAGAVDAFAQAYPALYRQADADDRTVVPITFWTNGPYGPSSRMRMIDSATWADIEDNYAAAVRDELGRLMGGGFEPGKDGQLLLWQGPPGTGKTWALRALASEWNDWAEFHYITDPDAFFVSNPVYMIDVLLADTYQEFTAPAEDGDSDVVTSVRDGEKWKVLILEDTGELLAANAKEAYGQGLSRLLNVVDGMVGQGLRVLAIVTTNDELDELHPAATRPGRCASQVAFAPLSAEEATEWAGRESEAGTIADLYARASEGDAEEAFEMGECANCGHMDDQHDDGDDGACSVAGCDCEQYAEATDAAADDAETVTAASRHREEIPAGTTRLMRQGIIVDVPIETAANTIVEERLPDPNPSPAAPEPVAVEAVGEKRWQAVLAVEGSPTADGRMFAPGAVKWRDLPLSLGAMLDTPHADAVTSSPVCGRIDRIWREGSLIMGEGVFDSGEYGQEIARMVADGTLRGISIDFAVKDWTLVTEESVEAGDPQEADPVDAMFGDGIKLFLDGMIGAATVCPFPAFSDATIAVLASADQPLPHWVYTHQSGIVVTDRPVAESLTASAAGLVPTDPPAAWFDDPALDGPTPLAVGDDGRVYGHLAAWGTCHIGLPGCTQPPGSESGYAYFNLGEVVCDDGTRVAVGKLTLGTGHADPHLGFRGAIEHYDHTGSVVAHVRAGEDDHGIWVAGALHPEADSTRVRELRAAPLSGDWRPINGYLELVAALAVNVPGFPVPRGEMLQRGDEVLSLVAAGALDPAAPRIDRATREKLAAVAASSEGTLDDDEALAVVVALARSPLPTLEDARELLSEDGS